MRALPEIKVVMKFPGACRAAHGVIPFCWCVPLLAHDRPIIRYPSLKRSQNVFAICLDIAMCSPYNLFAPFGRPSPWKVSIGTGPNLCPEDWGFVVSPDRLQAQTSTVQPFHTASASSNPWQMVKHLRPVSLTGTVVVELLRGIPVDDAPRHLSLITRCHCYHDPLGYARSPRQAVWRRTLDKRSG